MDQDASPDRLVFLIKVSRQGAKDRCAEHHRELITHVDYEEEQSGHPDRKMLVVFLAGSSDVILNDTLNEDLLQYRTDRIEPAHICAEIKTEPGLLRITRDKYVLDHAYNNEADNEDHADDAADYEIVLYPLLTGIQALEMDLEFCEDRENNRKHYKISFHHPGKDICIVFYEGRTHNVREDLNSNDLTGYCH